MALFWTDYIWWSFHLILTTRVTSSSVKKRENHKSYPTKLIIKYVFFFIIFWVFWPTKVSYFGHMYSELVHHISFYFHQTNTCHLLSYILQRVEGMRWSEASKLFSKSKASIFCFSKKWLQMEWFSIIISLNFSGKVWLGPQLYIYSSSAGKILYHY